METTSERDYQDRRVGPTVSKDKWLNHAKSKLAKGYTLIVGTNKKTANFYLKSKGFEACPYNVAKQLIKDGAVVEAGTHHLGIVYKLKDDVQVVKTTPRVPEPEDEEVLEDVENLLDDIADDEEEEDEADIDTFD
jgi:hypothetical protein